MRTYINYTDSFYPLYSYVILLSTVCIMNFYMSSFILYFRKTGLFLNTTAVPIKPSVIM